MVKNNLHASFLAPAALLQMRAFDSPIGCLAHPIDASARPSRPFPNCPQPATILLIRDFTLFPAGTFGWLRFRSKSLNITLGKGGVLEPIAIRAAVAAALIICLHTGTAAQAQTPGTPQTQTKPAAKPAVKPKPQAKPAAHPRESAPAEVAGHKSVCVASAIGHTFQVKAVGLTIFGNSEENLATESWGIDDAAAAAVRRILGKDYNVRRLAVSREAVASFETSRFSYADLLRTVSAGAPRCDVYVLLNRIATNYNGTNQYIAGLGILDGSSLVDRTWVFASFTVRVYAGDTFGLLKSVKPGTNPLENMFGGIGCTYRKVDKTWWPTPASAAVQNARLKTATRELVEEGVAQALKEVFEGA
jgi:hypothetical protein